jgi:nucleoside-diphosphate-sugar epimerase
MRVAITGANGFIGKLLVARHLSLGDEVRVLSRQDRHGWSRELDVVIGDLTQDGDHLNKLVAGADVLYHCAGELNDEDKMYALHVDGTHRLMKTAKGEVGRWVQLSSVGAYGACNKDVITELTPEHPENTYEITKTKSDEIVRQSGIPFVILRPSIVFGATMTNHSLHQMLRMIRKGLFFYIGKPGALVNYIHVDDVVEALVLCATDSKAIGKTYNLSQTTSLESMVDALMAGSDLKVNPYRFPLFPVHALAVLFGWIPGFPLTPSRIAALTNRCRYLSNRIELELAFEFGDSLEHRFQTFGSEVGR